MPRITPRLQPTIRRNDLSCLQASTRHTHSSASSKLSAAERKRRATVAHPADGFGFAHGSSKLSPRANRRLDMLLSRAHTYSMLTIVVGTSGSGSLAANRQLAAARNAAVAAALRDRGFKGPIVTKLAITPPDGHDDPNARTVHLKVDNSFPDAWGPAFDGKRALQQLMSARPPAARPPKS